MTAVFAFSVPVVFLAILGVALFRRVDILNEFAEGAREGVRIILGILPMLLLMQTVLSMVQGSGLLVLLAELLRPLGTAVGVPPELFGLALLRPVSGSGSIAQLSEYYALYGPDSAIGRMASVLAASTETTLYTVSLYGAAAGRQKMPAALISGLTADFCAFLLSVLTVRLFFG